MEEVKVKTVKSLYSTEEVLLESVSSVYQAYEDEIERKGYLDQSEADSILEFNGKARQIADCEADEAAFMFPIATYGLVVLPIVKKEDVNENKIYMPLSLQFNEESGEIEEIVLTEVEVR